MSDLYAVDTNIIVWLNREQPRDIYPSVWARMEELIADGRAVMPREVHEELKRIDDICAPWAKQQPNFIVEPDAAELAIVASITNAHPTWVQDQANSADPFLIAHAAERGLVVVTLETRKGAGVLDHNLKIPNVADEWNVDCRNFRDLARSEGWVF